MELTKTEKVIIKCCETHGTLFRVGLTSWCHKTSFLEGEKVKTFSNIGIYSLLYNNILKVTKRALTLTNYRFGYNNLSGHLKEVVLSDDYESIIATNISKSSRSDYEFNELCTLGQYNNEIEDSGKMKNKWVEIATKEKEEALLEKQLDTRIDVIEYLKLNFGGIWKVGGEGWYQEKGNLEVKINNKSGNIIYSKFYIKEQSYFLYGVEGKKFPIMINFSERN